MRSSCIQSPSKNHFIQLYEWQVQFCQGSHCAALILAHFIAWYDLKHNHDEYYSDNISEIHGDSRSYNQNAYLFFSIEEISRGILRAYGKNSILKALHYLQKKGVISTHNNPNPKYYFDKTKYFMFYPEKCREWIEQQYLESNDSSDHDCYIDHLVLNDESDRLLNQMTPNNQEVTDADYVYITNP